jgi:hypothetical protein
VQNQLVLPRLLALTSIVKSLVLVCVLLIVPFCSCKIQIMVCVFLKFLFNLLMKLDSSYCASCVRLLVISVVSSTSGKFFFSKLHK